MLARLHRDVLRTMLGEDFANHHLGGASAPILRSLAGYIDGATPAGFAGILNAADAHGADTIWLDGSNLGRIAHMLRRERPALRIVTFCHNVEARFFLGALRRAPGPRAAAVLFANCVAERLALRHSDTVVALSARDSGVLRRLYGRAADQMLPMALADQARDRPTGADASTGPLLFVGGAFYANRAGIGWFAREVAPRISAATEVLGHGMEDMRALLETAPGVRVIGPVDRLEPRYHAALAAIAPIFDGSGMKTKVAEALMFGKRVIGTPEAFSGYAEDVVAANWCCADANAFVAAVAAAQAAALPAFDPALRRLYDRDHSPAAARTRLAQILGLPDQIRVA